jgi:heat shock protein HtpX
VNIFDLSGSTRALFAAAIALVPAVAAHMRGRQIARFADDPALPERLFTGTRTASGSLVFSMAALIMVAGGHAIWAIPLAIIACVGAGLPLRRILYNETWSLASYLSFVIRFFIAFWHFWILVGALPALALWAGERAWIVALVMGAALMLLAERQAELIRWLIGARPIADQAIRARFERLVAASGLAAPHFEVVDLKGGSIANAFAMASLGRSSVVFSGPLLERLDADEADAICAHELAHLEYYNPRRLRQRRLVSRALIAGGVVFTPFFQQLMPSFASLACAAWPVVVLMAILFLVHDRQKHETASDLRAVALTGNPEALVRALTRVHAIARIPRRWDAELERHMSHPSLKRRIQDIRAAAGTPPAALGDAAVFESLDGTARVVFGDETLEWIEGTSASYRLRYDRLHELRIAATATGETSLLAIDRTGHRWQMLLRVSDVPRIQAVLDIVDARVETSAAARPIQPMLVRTATFVVFIVSINSGLFAVAVVLGMTLMRPEAPLVGAAGLAAMAGAVLTWRDPAAAYGFIPDEFTTIYVAVLVASGALLVGLAYVRRHDEIPQPVWKLIGVVAAAALASWVLPLVGATGIDAVALHQAAREWPSMVVLPLALAGAMIWSARAAVRMSAALAVVASAAAVTFGSQQFLDRFGGDMFLMPAANVNVRTLDRPVNEFTVPFGISELQISPGGLSMAAVARRHDNRVRVHIGRAGETLTPIEADGALFVDDDRVLVWTVDGSRTDLREVLVDAPDAASWQLRVAGLATPSVSLDPQSKRWRLGSAAGVDVVEAREGVIGSDEIRSYQWKMPEGHGSPFMPIALSGNRALVLEPRPDLSSPITNPLGAFMFVLANAPHWRSTIWAVGDEGATDLGTSRLELECHLLPLADRGVCQIFDASRTRFFTMDAATRGITAVGSLPGRFFVGEAPRGPWITGWYRSDLVAVRLAPAGAIRIAGPDGARAHTLAVSDRAAAGVWFQMPATSTLRVDPISETLGSSVIRIYEID